MIDKDSIPKHWKIKNLEDVCRKISLNNIKIKLKDYLPQGSFPIVDQGSELIGGYSNNSKFIVPEEPPYVVFGDHTKVKKYINFKFIAGADGIKVLKPLSELDPKFLFYCLQIIKIPDKGYARHFQFLEKENVPIPPILEQYKIVAKIEELFSELDKGNQQLETIRLQLKTYRQSVLKWAFEGRFTNKEFKIGQLPEGWRWVELDDICESKRKCSYGVLVPGDHEEDGIRLLRVGDINDTGQIDQINLKKISPLIANKYKRTFLEGGEVVISLVGAIGRTAVVPDSLKGANIARAVGVIPISKDISSKFVELMLRSPLKIKEHNEKSHEVARKTLNLEDVKNSKIPLPPRNIQEQIVQEIEIRLSVCDKLEETITNCLQQSESVRQSILKQAFEGKMVYT